MAWAARIYVCHSTEDAAWADSLVKLLNRAGAEAWHPHDGWSLRSSQDDLERVGLLARAKEARRQKRLALGES